AIHPVRHPTMSWNTIPKILNLKSPLQPTRKESSERGYQTRKRCQDVNMKLNRRNIDLLRDRKQFSKRRNYRGRDIELARIENGIRVAVEAGPGRYPEFLSSLESDNTGKGEYCHRTYHI